MNVAPKHDSASFATVSGYRGNYFNRFDRDSRRYDASATLAIAIPEGWGQHLMRAGGQLAQTTYDGIDASQSVIVTGATGSAIARIDYLGDTHVGADNTEIAGFLEDEWAPASNLTIRGGVRYAYERIAGEQTLAPRVDASFRPFEHGRTVIKGGAGIFYDKLPLNAADFASHQSRQITEYDGAGNPTEPSVRVEPHRGGRPSHPEQHRLEHRGRPDARERPARSRRLSPLHAVRSAHRQPEPRGRTLTLSSDGRSRVARVRGDAAPPVQKGGH